MNRTDTIRLAVAFAAALILSPCLYAAESKVWVEFEDGKRLFRQKEFGQALNSFRSAANERRKMFEAASARSPRPWIPRRPRGPADPSWP